MLCHVKHNKIPQAPVAATPTRFRSFSTLLRASASTVDSSDDEDLPTKQRLVRGAGVDIDDDDDDDHHVSRPSAGFSLLFFLACFFFFFQIAYFNALCSLG